MKKIIYLFFSAFCFISYLNIDAQTIGSGLNCFMSNQNNTKSSNVVFPQRFITETRNNKEYISLIMRVNKDCNLNFLQKYDCIIGHKTGRIVTLKINVKELPKLVKEKEIIEIETSRIVGSPDLKNAVKDFNAQDIWEGTGLNKTYTGKDVLIGIVDWGIDYTHPTFYDTIGDKYRIVAVWDQFRKQGPAPEGFDYGTVFIGKDDIINAKCDTSNQLDTAYHATHVGGIAAGGGAGTKYIGVAPEANLLFCTWICDEAHYMDCCIWMKNIAKAMNKRLVINNSWGVYHFGYMDGSSMMDEFINTMSDEDSIVFVISAGNNGTSSFHIKADFDNTESDTLKSEIEFNLPTPYRKDYWGEAITMQSEGSQIFSSRLEFYSNNWTKIGETPLMTSDGSTIQESVFLTESGDSIIYRGSSHYPNNNKHLADWEVRLSNYKNGLYHIVLNLTATQGVVHAWNLSKLSKAVGNTGFKFINSQNGFLEGDDHYGVSEPALCEKAITVAAHKFKKNEWHPEIAGFSSRGPNLTPYLKPDISAPGYAIVSSLSSFSNTVPKSTQTITFNGKDYGFGALNGTSMSGPMVTGSAALILQANPKLTPQEVKQIILQTAKTDEYTDVCPNDTWGYGKLNTYEAVKMAEKKVGLITAKDNSFVVFPIPAKDILYIEGLENNAEISITDINSRVLINKKMNSETIDINNLESGVYILTINQKGNTENIKIIKK